MADTQTFQFTLGPVQGFVAQARRTRDFWAGSFILSWLSSAAIACIQKQGGTVQFPVPDEGYMHHLYNEAGKQNHPRPQQGSIPNRFMATTAQVPQDFHPEWVTQTVQAAWRALADTVWAHDLADVAGAPTQAIWSRQVEQFWDITWVLSDGSEPSLLDRRKNWRSATAPDEPGHKCMMMDGWQELSGVTHTDMKAVNAFWEKLAASGKTGMASDLGKGEQLCALAFIKRRFSRYFDKVQVAMPGALGTLHGWQVPSAVPSVAFVAAAPWLARAIENHSVPANAFESLHEAARQITSYTEAVHVQSDTSFEIDIRCVQEAAKNRSQQDGFRRLWAGLDGQIYFPSALQNPRIFDNQPAAQQVLKQLQNLRRSANLQELPSPYYAILLMDGDQLGKHMGDKDKQTPISKALNAFTRDAGSVVRDHNGFLIYAGGDDVLALLPLEDALPAAAALQKSYKEAFTKESPADNPIDSTLSGAIEFVHIRTPLTRVLQDAHRLLDDVAKEQTGRNAIAVRVWKPSGQALQWAMPWEKALDASGQVAICEVARQFAAQKDDGARFSNKFFFRMKDVLERFGSANAHTLQKLLLAEYLHSYDNLGKNADDSAAGSKEALEQHLHSLLDQCWQWQRSAAGAPAQHHAQQPINPDGPLLVRFLAQKGLEDQA